MDKTSDTTTSTDEQKEIDDSLETSTSQKPPRSYAGPKFLCGTPPLPKCTNQKLDDCMRNVQDSSIEKLQSMNLCLRNSSENSKDDLPMKESKNVSSDTSAKSIEMTGTSQTIENTSRTVEKDLEACSPHKNLVSASKKTTPQSQPIPDSSANTLRQKSDRSIRLEGPISADNNQMEELSAKFFSERLGSPRLVLAPMVDASELAWRVLARRKGAQLCYTPMLHSGVFRRDPKYRQESLQTCEGDRPLIVQFCGNDPDVMLEAALLAQDYCDAVDINLGCPQAIAKRGRYGSYLQDDWPLLENMVNLLSSRLTVPVTCKIRVFPDIEKTVTYARMLERAGCQMLTVHGRTREQKGPMTGLASWDHIRAVKQNVRIPVLANGNIQYLHDTDRCLAYTGVDGVMAAEGHLYNPAIFQGRSQPVWEVAAEYLELVRAYPCPSSYVRGHLFKLFQHIMVLPENSEQRSALAVAQNVDDYDKVVSAIRERYSPFYEGQCHWPSLACEDSPENSSSYDLILPPWMCQPYERPPPEEHLKKIEENQNNNCETTQPKRHYEDTDGNTISRKRMKKLRRIQRRPVREPTEYVKRTGEYCLACPNPIGDKCIYTLCKKCCREKCYHENLDCHGHRILVKTRREIAIKYAAQRENGLNQAVVENDENRRNEPHNTEIRYMDIT